jgi:hypothetical protein
MDGQIFIQLTKGMNMTELCLEYSNDIVVKYELWPFCQS